MNIPTGVIALIFFLSYRKTTQILFVHFEHIGCMFVPVVCLVG